MSSLDDIIKDLQKFQRDTATISPELLALLKGREKLAEKASELEPLTLIKEISKDVNEDKELAKEKFKIVLTMMLKKSEDNEDAIKWVPEILVERKDERLKEEIKNYFVALVRAKYEEKLREDSNFNRSEENVRNLIESAKEKIIRKYEPLKKYEIKINELNMGINSQNIRDRNSNQYTIFIPKYDNIKVEIGIPDVKRAKEIIRSIAEKYKRALKEKWDFEVSYRTTNGKEIKLNPYNILKWFAKEGVWIDPDKVEEEVIKTYSKLL